MAKQKQQRAKRVDTNPRGAAAQKPRSSIDIPFLVLVLILLVFGLIMLFSASYVTAIDKTGDMYYYFRRQITWAAIGLGVMFLVMIIKMSTIKKLVPLIMVLNLGLLAATLVMGRVGGGAQRWLMIGGIRFQPSEITKIAIVLFFAYYISRHYKAITDPVSPRKSPAARFLIPRREILVLLFMLALNAGLVILEPHYSGAIILVVVGIIILFAAGVPFHWFVKLAVVLATAAAVLLTFGHNYVQRRWNSYLDPFADMRGDSWQIVQSLYAIGSGGLLGVGLGNSVQKHLYLPEPQNDFIFAIVCEELGVVGAILVIVLFALLIWRGFSIALKSNDVFHRLTVIGIMTLVSVQFILNIAVVTHLVPVTGISLPFFSYGGTALLILLAEMGLVLNISRYSVK
ncbi:MAG: putative lipid II flippase FtsW [Clostridia bacterium]|nr:putative lipid II flippase FtsW [Clostridia bacterium]